MKKFSMIVLAAMAVCSFAAAQAKKPAAAPKTIACAVMPDHKLDIAKATKDKMFADYKGNRYYFCCAGCPDAFKKNPAKYAKAPHLPTPKAKKK